jgi:serine O-acetyltransferase
MSGTTGWWSAYRADIRRYSEKSGRPAWVDFLIAQGLWALLQYRLAHAVYKSRLPGWIKKILLVFFMLWQKWIEVVAGICLPYAAEIGAGFYIGHFGQIILHPNVVLGQNCNIAQGVSLAVSGRGEYRGTPVIGDRVYIAANATVAGKITVGNDVVIGANSLVNRDVPEHCTVVGVPAVVVSDKGSEGYI